MRGEMANCSLGLKMFHELVAQEFTSMVSTKNFYVGTALNIDPGLIFLVV